MTKGERRRREKAVREERGTTSHLELCCVSHVASVAHYNCVTSRCALSRSRMREASTLALPSSRAAGSRSAAVAATSAINVRIIIGTGVQCTVL